MAYLESVWDLIETKKYNDAWVRANAALTDIMGQISSQGWQQGPYKQKAEVMGVEWAKEDFISDMTIEVGSILYAMSYICYEERKYEIAYKYLYASYLLNWGSSGVKSFFKVVLKNVTDKSASERQAKQLFEKWHSVGLGL